MSGMILLLLGVVVYLLWQQRKIRQVEQTLRRERQHTESMAAGSEERLRTILKSFRSVLHCLIGKEKSSIATLRPDMLGLSRAERLVGKFDDGEWEIFRPDGTTVMPHAECQTQPYWLMNYRKVA